MVELVLTIFLINKVIFINFNRKFLAKLKSHFQSYTVHNFFFNFVEKFGLFLNVFIEKYFHHKFLQKKTNKLFVKIWAFLVAGININ